MQILSLLVLSLILNIIQFVFTLWVNNSWYKQMMELNKNWYEKSIKIINQLSDGGEEQNENANISDDNVNHMRDNSDSGIHQQ